MRAGSVALALTLSGLAFGAGAEDASAPPVWANLAECSAVFSAAAQADGYSGADPDLMAQANQLAERFYAQAIRRAEADGQSAPQADVDSIMAYLIPRWENRIDNLFTVRSNLDWIAYCRGLGLDQGVLPLVE